MVKKQYIASYSKKHLELRSIIDFLFVLEFAGFFFVFVFIVNFLLFSCIEFPLGEI